MADTITIKTTGGDIHITPATHISVQDHADWIINEIDDDDRETDWLRFHVDRGQALVYAPSVTGVIARKSGKAKGF